MWLYHAYILVSETVTITGAEDDDNVQKQTKETKE